MFLVVSVQEVRYMLCIQEYRSLFLENQLVGLDSVSNSESSLQICSQKIDFLNVGDQSSIDFGLGLFLSGNSLLFFFRELEKIKNTIHSLLEFQLGRKLLLIFSEQRL